MRSSSSTAVKLALIPSASKDEGNSAAIAA